MSTSQPPHGLHSRRRDRLFLSALAALGGSYVVLLAALLVAIAAYALPARPWNALLTPQIRYAAWLSLLSATLSALLGLWVAVPIGYLLSRHRIFGRRVVEALVDIPIVLPPMALGLSLLLLFRLPPLRALAPLVIYEVPAVVLAQFSVAAALAVRTLRVTFDQIDPRREQVAMTLGCTRAQAFVRVVLPEARRGCAAALTLAWARAFGEFGPVLVFAGATRMKTEVLTTSVYLELTVGNVEAAAAVALLMLVVALGVLLVARRFGLGR